MPSCRCFQSHMKGCIPGIFMMLLAHPWRLRMIAQGACIWKEIPHLLSLINSSAESNVSANNFMKTEQEIGSIKGPLGNQIALYGQQKEKRKRCICKRSFRTPHFLSSPHMWNVLQQSAMLCGRFSWLGWGSLPQLRNRQPFGVPSSSMLAKHSAIADLWVQIFLPMRSFLPLKG